MEIIRTQAFARAGLLGNPSDGFHGKTISLIMRDFVANVILYEWERIEFVPSQEDHSSFDSMSELVHDVELHGYYGGIRLVKATVKKFFEFCQSQPHLADEGQGLHDRKFAIRYETNIPRAVGLAGSSAIIVATLRALQSFYNVQIPLHVQPSLVLHVEKDELGIQGGLQDRVIQVYEGLVYMDFSPEATVNECGFECGTYETLDPSLLPPLYVAYSTEMGEPTEAFHNPLRALYDSGDQSIRDAMSTFAECARQGREAILANDPQRLFHLIDKNYDTRASICRLPDKHVKMIEVARNVGASAKFAGSGGAIVGTVADDSMLEDLRKAFEAIGCSVLRPIII